MFIQARGRKMADRVVDETTTEVPEIPELLNKVIQFSLNEAITKRKNGEDAIPFTALAVGKTLFIEDYLQDTVDECFEAAKQTVENAQGAKAYAFCYDGYVDIDGKEVDAIIAEGGLPGAQDAFAVGYLYAEDENGMPQFEEKLAYIGIAPNFMISLLDPSEYSADEVNKQFKIDGNEDSEDTSSKFIEEENKSNS